MAKIMIRNKTKNNVITDKKIILNNSFGKATGLMFKEKINNIGYIFPFSSDRIVSLHMWFVFQTIDVLFLDKNKKVIEIKKGFKPFSFYTPINKSRFVIELPENSIKKKNIIVGDIIEFKNDDP